MTATPGLSSFNTVSAAQLAGGTNSAALNKEQLGEREAFDRFVGGTFFRQLLGAMQKTVGKPAYFHGGQGEHEAYPFRSKPAGQQRERGSHRPERHHAAGSDPVSETACGGSEDPARQERCRQRPEHPLLRPMKFGSHRGRHGPVS